VFSQLFCIFKFMFLLYFSLLLCWFYFYLCFFLQFSCEAAIFSVNYSCMNLFKGRHGLLIEVMDSFQGNLSAKFAVSRDRQTMTPGPYVPCEVYIPDP